MPRRVLPLLVAICAAFHALAQPALANPQDAETAKALLETISTGPADGRAAAAEQLVALGPHVITELGEFLKRPHTSTDAQRRAVLAKIKAQVPDKKGRFTSPGRQEEKELAKDDALDWLPMLTKLAEMPALGEVIADVAAIRALARSMKIEAAQILVDVAFGDETMVYRDDCGRQLRKMSPYSVPALIVASQQKKERSKVKYTNYQLERIDRQEPNKALAAGEGNEALQIAILQAFGSTEHREAVPAVFGMINDDAPRVRAAAREAWLAYVTGPEPPPAPKQHLKLPGGKETEEEMPLWFTSLELARIELARRAEQLWPDAEPMSEKWFEAPVRNSRFDEEAVTKQIFDYYDLERSKRDDEVYLQARAMVDQGNLPGALEVFDRLLAEDPQRKERGEMAPVYYRQAEQLAGEGQWVEAAALYSKAHGLDPEGHLATDALAAHYYALGKAAEAAGKDGAASFRKAVELKPDYAEAKSAARAATPEAKVARKRWMLYAAAGVALGALFVLALGLRRRRA